MKKIIFAAIVVVLVAGGGMLLYRWAIPQEHEANTALTSPPSETPQLTTPAPSAVTSPIPSSIIKEITVIGKNYSFSPATIVIKKGDNISLMFKNQTGFHDFKIDELGVATKRISGGQEETVQFTADKVGTFQYYCSVGDHRAMGMKGTLTVQE